MRGVPYVVLVVALSAAVPLAADVYEQSSDDNSAATTRLELSHGAERWHDLTAVGGAADQDWFRIRQQPYSSYEVSVDGVAGEVGKVRLQRVAADGTTVLQNAQGVGLGVDRSLRFANQTGSAVDLESIVVRDAACTTTCGPNAVYRIRMIETTASISRFNNTGTQVTVLLLQNPASVTATGAAYFWSAAGALLGSTPFSLSPKSSLVLTTSNVAGVAGMSGSITVAHDARYADLAGKAVALEPATGFSFDTPLAHRAR